MIILAVIVTPFVDERLKTKHLYSHLKKFGRKQRTNPVNMTHAVRFSIKQPHQYVQIPGR